MESPRFAGLLLLLAAACSSPPPPRSTPPIAPAPLAETAVPQVAVLQVELQRLPPAKRVYLRSATIEHQWTDARSRDFRIAFRIHYSCDHQAGSPSPEIDTERWQRTAALARQILEEADLTTESGTLACEELLRESLRDELFAADDPSRPAIESLFWQRVLWS